VRLWFNFLIGITIFLSVVLLQTVPFKTGMEADYERNLGREEKDEDSSTTGQGLERRQRGGHHLAEDRQLQRLVSRHFDSVFAESETTLRIYQTDDFLLIRAGRLMGVAEIGLLESGGEGNPELIREMKTRLLESTIRRLMSGVSEVTGLKLKESYISYSPADDEMMVILNIDTAKEAV
jgi:hypothetical protein